MRYIPKSRGNASCRPAKDSRENHWREPDRRLFERKAGRSRKGAGQTEISHMRCGTASDGREAAWRLFLSSLAERTPGDGRARKKCVLKPCSPRRPYHRPGLPTWTRTHPNGCVPQHEWQTKVLEGLQAKSSKWIRGRFPRRRRACGHAKECCWGLVDGNSWVVRLAGWRRAKRLGARDTSHYNRAPGGQKRKLISMRRKACAQHGFQGEVPQMDANGCEGKEGTGQRAADGGADSSRSSSAR